MLSAAEANLLKSIVFWRKKGHQRLEMKITCEIFLTCMSWICKICFIRLFVERGVF